MLYYIIVQTKLNFKEFSRKMVVKNRISGVICEFNPLHNGHAALLRHMRAAAGGPIVCAMSGNFVQRGEAAALDKWSRARLALQNGADLVLELPLPWALAGAERFAFGGVSLLNALGADTLFFGSECGETAPLMRIAEYLLSAQLADDLRPHLAAGLPFAVARTRAIEKALGAECAALCTQPNNILGIEYCKAILQTGGKLEPHTLRRIAVGHDDDAASGRFASASLLRRMSADAGDIAPYVPEATAARIRTLQDAGQYPADLRHLERAILAFLSTASPEALRRVPDVAEGIERRIRAAAGRVQTLEALYDAVKTKRYSHARIRRIALAAYLGLTDDLPAAPPYLRVLGMTAAGAALIRAASPSLPYVMRPADLKKLPADAQRVFELEARADDMYALCTAQRRPAGLDYTERLIRV